jgi:hypothetical protein
MKQLLASLLIAVSATTALIMGPCGDSYAADEMANNGACQRADVGPVERRPSLPAQPAQRGPLTPGELEWRTIRDGFDAGELAVIAGGGEVDRICLGRIAPAKFRFEVHTEATTARDLDSWITKLGAILIINGSYYAPGGAPDTPVLSAGIRLGPADYDAKAGAFIASAGFTGIRDLARQSWQDAFTGARDAMVSYPLLIGEDGASRARASERLAKRSFVGQDLDGLIIVGTTVGNSFSLYQLSMFLRQAPLELKLALNLDGGPVACQGISLDGFKRRLCEIEALPIVLAVFPK